MQTWGKSHILTAAYIIGILGIITIQYSDMNCSNSEPVQPLPPFTTSHPICPYELPDLD